MRRLNRCGYCDTSALALAAQYRVSPDQAVTVRKVKGGVLVRCLCCKRRWVSNAKWVRVPLGSLAKKR